MPQGGVLSTTLFDVGVGDIVKCLDNLSGCSLCVGGFCVCCRSEGVGTIERQMQQGLNGIESWVASDGFGFSGLEAQCVHFCRLRRQRDDPASHLYGSPVLVVGESGFLGIVFDGEVGFVPHMGCLRAGCSKALGLFRVLSLACFLRDGLHFLSFVSLWSGQGWTMAVYCVTLHEDHVFGCLVLCKVADLRLLDHLASEFHHSWNLLV